LFREQIISYDEISGKYTVPTSSCCISLVPCGIHGNDLRQLLLITGASQHVIPSLRYGYMCILMGRIYVLFSWWYS